MNNLMQLFSIIIISTGLLMSCGNGTAEAVKGPSVKGQIANAKDMQVFFDRTSLDNSSEILAKGMIDAKGQFTLAIEDGFEPGLYRLRIGAKRLPFPLSGDEKKVEISGDLKSFSPQEVTIKGSDIAKQYNAFVSENIKSGVPVSTIAEKMATLNNPLLRFALASTYLPFNEAAISTHKATYDALNAAQPNSQDAQMYGQKILQAEQSIAAAKRSGRVSVGSPAPDIVLEDPNGKVRRLSDLKGDIVLLDFWASWCGPCRRANPHVVEVYHKYKDQGFNVYSVSLDGIHPRILPRLTTEEEKAKQLENAKRKWLAAIEKDKLEWDSHVSDLQHWNSPIAKMYGVSSIPRTFLIDREGNIAVINPRNNLEAELQKLL